MMKWGICSILMQITWFQRVMCVDDMRSTKGDHSYWPSLTWSFTFYDQGNITSMQGYYNDDTRKPTAVQLQGGGITVPISNLFNYSIFPFWNNQDIGLDGSGCAYSKERVKAYCFGGKIGSLTSSNWSSPYLYEYHPSTSKWKRYYISLSHFANGENIGVFRPQTIMEDKYLISYGGYVPSRKRTSSGKKVWSVEHRQNDGQLHVLNVDNRDEFVLTPTDPIHSTYPKSRQGSVWVRWAKHTALMYFGVYKKSGEEAEVFHTGYLVHLDIDNGKVTWEPLVAKPEGLVSPTTLAYCAYVKDPDSETLYVFGGSSSKTTAFLNEVWRLSKDASNSWKWALLHNGLAKVEEGERSDYIPSRRAQSNMVKVGRHLVIFGGYFNTEMVRLSDPISHPRVFFFDTCTNTWVQPLTRLDPFSSCLFVPESQADDDNEVPTSMNTGTIIMIVILSSVFLAVLVGIVIFCRRRKIQSRKILGISFVRPSTNKLVGNAADGEGRYFVVEDFLPTMVDEISLRIGDEVMISHVYSDGWATGINTATKNIGVFPVICIRPLPPLNNSTEKLLKQVSYPSGAAPPYENPTHVLDGFGHADTFGSTHGYAPESNTRPIINSMGIPHYEMDMKLTTVPIVSTANSIHSAALDVEPVQPSAPPTASILATTLKTSVFSSDLFSTHYDPQTEQASPVPKEPSNNRDNSVKSPILNYSTVPDEHPEGLAWSPHPSVTSHVTAQDSKVKETITIQNAGHDYPVLQRPNSIQSSCGDIVNPPGPISRASTEVLRKKSQQSRISQPRSASGGDPHRLPPVTSDALSNVSSSSGPAHRTALNVVQELAEDVSPVSDGQYDLTLRDGKQMDEMIRSELCRARTVKMTAQDYGHASPTSLSIPDPFSQIVIPVSPSLTSHADVVLLDESFDPTCQPANNHSSNEHHHVDIPVRSNSLFMNDSLSEPVQESKRESICSSCSTESIHPSSSCSHSI